MTRWWRCLAALTVLVPALIPALASAQTTVDGRVWLTLALQERSGTSSPWRWSGDAVLRTRDGVAAVDSTTFRGAVGYDLTRRSSLWGGYAFVPSFPATGGAVIEHRFFGQYSWAGSAGRAALSLRSRGELRAFEGNSGPVWRLRQQVRYTRPFEPDGRFSLVLYEEVAVHANTTTRFRSGLDQNRAFAGIGRPLTPALRLEVGYLNQYSRSRVAPHRMNHILSMVSTVAF